MSETFDAYHLWLGIPPEEQPPNHFRLLGVALFEDHPEVIEAAADRQMAYLRTFQTGPRSALSQRLLNEVAAAKIRLLNPAKRAAYDEELRRELGLAGPPVVVVEPPPGSPPGSRLGVTAPPPSPQYAPAALPRGTGEALPTAGASGAFRAGEPASPATESVPGASASPGRIYEQLAPTGAAASESGGQPIVVAETSRARSRSPSVMPIIVAAGVAGVLLFAIYVMLQAMNPEGKLIVLWPEGQREGGRLEINGSEVDLPVEGPIELPYPPGQYILIAERPGMESITHTVNLEPRQQMTVGLNWQAEVKVPEPRKRSEAKRGRPQPAQTNATPSTPPDVPPSEQAAIVAGADAGQPDSGNAQPREPGGGSGDFDAVMGAVGTNLQTSEKSAQGVATDTDTAPSATAVEAPPVKQPVPGAEEQQAVLSALNEVYQFDRRRSADELLSLAWDLIEQSKLAGDNAVERYVLLRCAAEAASEGGDAVLMIDAARELGRYFDVDLPRAEESLLAKFDPADDEQRVSSYARAASMVIDEAIRVDRFDIAAAVVEAAAVVVMQPLGVRVRSEIIDRKKQIDGLRDSFEVARKATETLAADPDDVLAHVQLARWHAYMRGDWEKAIPHLVRSPDVSLRALAEAERVAPPIAADEMVARADSFWDAAQARSDEARDPLLRRAAYWYRKALPGLPSGDAQTKVAERLAEAASLPPPPAAAPEGAEAANLAEGPALRNQWCNLLPRTDLARDSVAGHWTRAGGDLVVDSADHARLMLPAVVSGADYDLELELSRMEGDDAVAVVLPVGDRQCAFIIGAEGKYTGAELIANMPVTDKRNPSRAEGPTLAKVRRHMLYIAVRNDARRAELRITIDGERFKPLVGDPKQLSLPPAWRLPAGDRPGVGAHHSELRVHGARLRVLSGMATLLASGPR